MIFVNTHNNRNLF